jgi:hypothetical protein
LPQADLKIGKAGVDIEGLAVWLVQMMLMKGRGSGAKELSSGSQTRLGRRRREAPTMCMTPAASSGSHPECPRLCRGMVTCRVADLLLTERENFMSQTPEVLAQPVSTFPDLQSGEVICFETTQGIPVILFLACTALTVFPPFIFGTLVLVYTWWNFRDGRFVLTNYRLIVFKKKAFGGWALDSIPLTRIKRIVDVGALTKPIRSMLIEHKSIGVYIEGSLMPKAKYAFVKDAKELIRRFEHEKATVVNLQVQP